MFGLSKCIVRLCLFVAGVDKVQQSAFRDYQPGSVYSPDFDSYCNEIASAKVGAMTVCIVGFACLFQNIQARVSM